MKLIHIFAKNVKEYRTAKELSQEKLAEFPDCIEHILVPWNAKKGTSP